MRQRSAKTQRSSDSRTPTRHQDPHAHPNPLELPESRHLAFDQVSCISHSRNSYMHKMTEIFMTIMDTLPYRVISCFIPEIPSHHKSMLESISKEFIAPYDGENPTHVSLLRRLWEGHNKVMFDDCPFEPVHERWKDLGFQSADPSTDFRGAGVFALHQLIYLVETYPNHWSRFLAAKDFLISCVAINVSMRIITLLRMSSQRNLLSVRMAENYTNLLAKEKLCKFIYSTNTSVSFYLLADVFCCYMYVLEKVWTSSGKSLIEFNRVLEQVCKKFERDICMSNAIDDLCVL
ncbi:unnamed protein product [Phytomonas sp. EM1]|nr:unnamed protein product [Phytomonas sp. EM1]|eukprot:CCW64743.1 unnamed protein product [Phytomonas sp. isolate EM1]